MFGDLLRRDAFVARKPLGGADSEGRPLRGHDPVGVEAWGTWGSPSSRDLELAGRMDVQVQAVVAGHFPLDVGWLASDLRGDDYIVTHVRPLVTHRRAFLTRHHG